MCVTSLCQPPLLLTDSDTSRMGWGGDRGDKGVLADAAVVASLTRTCPYSLVSPSSFPTSSA